MTLRAGHVPVFSGEGISGFVVRELRCGSPLVVAMAGGTIIGQLFSMLIGMTGDARLRQSEKTARSVTCRIKGRRIGLKCSCMALGTLQFGVCAQ